VCSHADGVANIEDVYVAPDWRELGFGDALLEAAMDDGRASGCVLIEGEALPGDREIKNLYERAGVTARLIVVSKKLV
jgi:GNAT superfamily N-acetyltransferase